MKGIAAFSALLAFALLAGGQARSLQNDGAQDLLTSEIDLSSLVSDQEVGETSMYAANSAAVNIASLLEEPMWDGVQGGPKCCVKCNGKNVTESNDKKPYSCWGFFTAFCKGHSEKACGAGGFVCKGHFVGAKFPGGKAAVCEGEIKSFGAKFIKAKGKRVAIFKKGGCLGTSSIIGLNKSDDESAQGLQWPSSLPQAWEDNFDGSDVLSKAMVDAKGSEEPLAQGRCNGFGGGVKAVKISGSDFEENEELAKAERKEMTLYSLEMKVNETMLDMGVPETMPSYASVDIKPVFQEAYQNGGCKITCNGKPAWFKGQFPCFGKLAVKCFAGEEAPKYAPDFFAASCKGFWSGIFGHKCKGQATGFVASEYYKKLNICTGKFGMFAKAKKSEGKFVAGKFCAGKSLGAFFLGDEDDSAKIAPQAS